MKNLTKPKAIHVNYSTIKSILLVKKSTKNIPMPSASCPPNNLVNILSTNHRETRQCHKQKYPSHIENKKAEWSLQIFFNRERVL